MNQIRETLEKRIKIGETDWEIFSAKLKRLEAPKKSVLLKTE